MAKTLTTIWMDFEKARSKADQLDQLADNLKKLADQQMEQTFQQIGNAWTGEEARTFLTKGKQLEEKVKRDGEQLRKIAAAIRTAARATYNAERRAILIAQSRDV